MTPAVSPNMSPAVSPPVPVTVEQVVRIVGEVWNAYLGLTIEPAPDAPYSDPAPDAPRSDPEMTGRVGISGAWQGSVELRCSTEHATEAAEAMFAAEPGSLAPDEIADALGELTNMVGGTIKCLLPEPSALSVPRVSTLPSAAGPSAAATAGSPPHTPSPNPSPTPSPARPVLEVGLRCGAAPVLVTVRQA